MGSTLGFTPAMRAALAALLALCLVGLTWRGIVIYQADQRAQKASAFLAELEGGSGPTPGEEATGKAGPAKRPEAGKRGLVVHVDGAVQNPGVYTFEEGARVNDAILAAGGALPEGVPGALNLAAPLSDGAKVYVYTRTELQPASQAPVAAQGASYTPITSTDRASGGASAGPSGLVNVNTASASELESVPGIGPATARAIIEHRSKHGSFKRVDDLMNVSGIGPKTLEKLRPYLQV